MNRTNRLRVDRVALLGVFLGSAALLLPFYVLKEHRLDSGVGFQLHAVSPLGFSLVCLFLLAALIGALRADDEATSTSVLAVTSLLLFGGVWIVAGVSGTQHLTRAELSLGRIAPTTGFWFLIVACFICLSTALHRTPSRLLRIGVVPMLVFALVFLFVTGVLDDIAFVREYRVRESRFLSELVAHLVIAATSVGAAVIVGVPAGIVAYRRSSLRRPVFAVVNGLQTIPSLALFGLMIAPLALLSQRFPFLRQMGIRGVGNTPAIIALFLYSLLPIIRNTFTSLSVMDPAVIEAGRGLGMTRRQLLVQVEVPISLPIILGGIRIAGVQTIGNTTVAALIGAGGLGNFVFQGLGQAAPDLIVMGVIPIVLLAVAVDRVFQFLVTHAVPGPAVERHSYE